MTRFAIIRNDESVLSTVDGRPHWLDYGVTLATDWRYAVQFETRMGANKSALMHGATVHTIGDDDATERYRTGDGGGVGFGAAARRPAGAVHSVARGRPERGVPPADGRQGAGPAQRRTVRTAAPVAAVHPARERGRDARLTAMQEYERVTGWPTGEWR